MQADGVWVLPNLPANQGQVRIRATCVDQGVVRSGQSDWITIPVNGARHVDEISFDAPVLIPVTLELTSPVLVLNAIGQTAQLAAIATYPDASQADVTFAERGTGYRTSNPAIATVDANGLVTARASGVALVSAVNEGALGVIRLQVVASGDSDGDARAVTRGVGDGFEPELEDEAGPNAAHRPELLQRVAADDGVDLAKLLVGQA